MKARQKKKKVAISFIRTRNLSACVFCRRSSEWQKFSWSCVLRRRWRRGRKIERGSCQSPPGTRPLSHSSRTSGATGLRPWGSPIFLRCNFASINVFCNKTFQIVRKNVKIRCYQARTTLQPWLSSSFCPLLTTYWPDKRYSLFNLRCDIFLIFSPDFHDLFKVVCSVASVWSWAGMRREDRELIRSSSESNTWWGNTCQQKGIRSHDLQHESSSESEDDFLETQVLSSTSSVPSRWTMNTTRREKLFSRSFPTERESTCSLHEVAGYQSAGSTGFVLSYQYQPDKHHILLHIV